MYVKLRAMRGIVLVLARRGNFTLFFRIFGKLIYNSRPNKQNRRCQEPLASRIIIIITFDAFTVIMAQ